MKQRFFLIILAILVVFNFFVGTAIAAEPKPNNLFSLRLENPWTRSTYEYGGLNNCLLGAEVVVVPQNDFLELTPYVYGELRKGIFLGMKCKTNSEGEDWAGGSFRAKSDRPFMGNGFITNFDLRYPTIELIVDYYIATNDLEGDRKYRKEAFLSFSLVRMGPVDAPPIRIVTEVQYTKVETRLVEFRPLVFELLLENERIRPFIGWEHEWKTAEGNTTQGNSAIGGISFNY